MTQKSITEAVSITLGLCDCCTAIHINLLDAEGNVFATASLPAENWRPFRARFDELARESVRRPSVAPGVQ